MLDGDSIITYFFFERKKMKEDFFDVFIRKIMLPLFETRTMAEKIICAVCLQKVYGRLNRDGLNDIEKAAFEIIDAVNRFSQKYGKGLPTELFKAKNNT
jgi:hypothetical protein